MSVTPIEHVLVHVTDALATCALAMPVMALVTPGPAVTSATPRPPVSWASACAM